MGIRQFALGITGASVDEAAEEFRIEPNASNWHRLELAMRAHQTADQSTNEQLWKILENAPREKIVIILSQEWADRLEHLRDELKAGKIQVFAADPLMA